MPVAYYECKCGVEHREIVSIDHTQDTQDPATGRWHFDPSKKHLKSYSPLWQCQECGAVLKPKEDPKAVPTRFNFNYMGSD